MRWFMRSSSIILVMLTLAACASMVPPSRLGEYLGAQQAPEPMASALPEQRPLRAGLVVIADTGAQDAAPSLPEEAQSRLAMSLKEQISQSLPISIDTMIPGEGIKAGSDPRELRELGRTHGVEYLVVAILSSTEQEYPVSLFLGWTTHRQPGFRRDNWSLVEVAVLDLQTGQALLRAEGRAMATLDSPMAPGINQWYPVVYLRPQDPERRIWPPTFEGAPITLRVVSMNQAAKRLILNLQDAWLQKRQSELEQVQG